MNTLDPFFIYKVSNAAGDLIHSSILYCSDLKPDVSLSAKEVRENLLLSASYAEMEIEWPSHGQTPVRDHTIQIFGPFFPGEPADQLTHAEYNRVSEGDLP